MGSQASPAEKYKIIQQMTCGITIFLTLPGCVNMLAFLVLDISVLKAAGARAAQDEQDKKDFEVILAAYTFRGYDKGVRGIYMRLLHRGIRMN